MVSGIVGTRIGAGRSMEGPPSKRSRTEAAASAESARDSSAMEIDDSLYSRQRYVARVPATRVESSDCLSAGAVARLGAVSDLTLCFAL